MGKSLFWLEVQGLYLNERWVSSYELGKHINRGGFSMDYEKTNVESTRYYLQLPVMAHWGFKLCDDVRLKLAVGPYVAVGIGGRTNAYVSSSKYNIDEETGVG